MHGALLYAGYLNHGSGRDLPEVSFYATMSITPQDLETRLSDMHSKGSTMSCAVVTGYLGNLIDSDSAMAIQSLLGLDSVYGEERFARLIGQLLSAGARIAQQIPDMKSILDE